MFRTRSARYAALIACSLLAGSCLANSPPPDPPVSTAPPQAVSTSTSNSSSTSAAISGSVSGAVSGSRSNATGGNATTGASTSSATAGPSTSSATSGPSTSAATSGDSKAVQGQGQSLSDTSHTDSRMYVLPGPAWTPPMSGVTCPTPTIENRNFSAGFGLITLARGDTRTDDCVDFTLLAGLIEQCQFADAKQFRDGMLVKRQPAFKPSPAGDRVVNYDPDACASARRLQAFGPPPITQTYVTHNYPPAAPVAVAPAECVKPAEKTRPRKPRAAAAAQACGKRT